mmetsp:Transcript_3172/g.5497  ORF Transcript_3172/g.5497 Transcript_3172/m.5497 type:complete len:207 (-) Transcript_3172:433-1053(-)
MNVWVGCEIRLAHVFCILQYLPEHVVNTALRFVLTFCMFTGRFLQLGEDLSCHLINLRRSFDHGFCISGQSSQSFFLETREVPDGLEFACNLCCLAHLVQQIRGEYEAGMLLVKEQLLHLQGPFQKLVRLIEIACPLVGYSQRMQRVRHKGMVLFTTQGATYSQCFQKKPHALCDPSCLGHDIPQFPHGHCHARMGPISMQGALNV